MTGLEAGRVYAEVGTFATDVEVEDLGAATVRYESDAIAVIEASSFYWGNGDGFDMVFVGKKGQARFALWGSKAEVFLTEAYADLPAREWVKREFQDEAHVEYYEDLARALEAGEEPPVTGEDGLAALEIVLAAYRAGGTGQPVVLPLEE